MSRSAVPRRAGRGNRPQAVAVGGDDPEVQVRPHVPAVCPVASEPFGHEVLRAKPSGWRGMY